MNIENRNEPIDELPIKRFRMPTLVTVDCPNCGQQATRDLQGNYLDYPPVNKPFDLYLYCHHCDEDQENPITVKVVLNVTLKPASIKE